MPIIDTAATRRRKTAHGPVAPTHDHDTDWLSFMISVESAYHNTLAGGARFLFTTDAADLFGTYLRLLPAEKLTHTCSACRRFIKTYGGLVSIAANGNTFSALWDPLTVPEFYRPAVGAMADAVSRAKVTGVFLSGDQTWGSPLTDSWTHLSVQRPTSHVFLHMTLTPGQARAAKREDFNTVSRALDEFSPTTLATALRLLNTDTFNRSERFIAPVQWLLALQWDGAGKRAWGDKQRLTNKRWRAVAEAPDGFCHPRAGVVGSLLEDLAQEGGSAFSFDEVRNRWNAKTHPLNFQRSQAAPSAGNIANAEKLIEKMGIASALNRRFARLDELELIWRPAPQRPVLAGDGVFGHLKPKGAAPRAAPIAVPRQTMTWEKFRRVVLPTAEGIEFFVPVKDNFTAILTAADPDAPGILKWDNPFSVYVYHEGSRAAQWRLCAGTWANVTGISLRPNLWGPNPQPHLGIGCTLILEGAVDRQTGQGNALFTDNLRPELHSVRSTIEAYSKSAVLGGEAEASACGIGFHQGLATALRVTAGGAKTEYKIDRWD